MNEIENADSKEVRTLSPDKVVILPSFRKEFLVHSLWRGLLPGVNAIRVIGASYRRERESAVSHLMKEEWQMTLADMTMKLGHEIDISLASLRPEPIGPVLDQVREVVGNMVVEEPPTDSITTANQRRSSLRVTERIRRKVVSSSQP